MPSHALSKPVPRTYSTGRTFIHTAVHVWNSLPDCEVGEMKDSGAPSNVGCINISCQHIDLLHASPYIYPVPVLMKQLSQPMTLFRFGACNSALSPVSLLQGRLIQRLMYLVSYRDKIREHDSTIVQQ
ncbi:uncharacterized protein LOC119727802 [Patiria miniata]|uniref:Uncharacterized protein n=1 Tax=Patiria miniata TaxID=46514 RepID=A0A913ZWA0_PATMI|nr:uncharacterized protein LOC119727802 [Patiria miniata]